MTPIQLDPNHQTNSLADTTPEQAKINTLYGVRAQVAKVNASRAADYEVQWKAYVAARDARPDATNLIVPVPAREEAVDMDANGWPTVYTTDNPVATPHTYIPSLKTPAASIFGGIGALAQPEPFPGAELYKPLALPSGRVFQRIA